MAEKNEPFAETGETAPECLLSWRGADGTVTSVGPLSRERAETLVQVYGRMYPDQTCWVEPLLREVRGLHLGRVRRSRSPLPIVESSDRDH